jgi:hypothetical protein
MSVAATPVWPGASARPYSYRAALGRLREFEGWRCLWRVVAGGVLLTVLALVASLLIVTLVPIGLLVLNGTIH